MADQYGWPVVDIYVDAVAPYPPVPRVVIATATSATFTWDPVADRGDGAGVAWDFGDRATLKIDGAGGFGQPYPTRSSITHVYSTFSRSGYVVRADVHYDVSWRVLAGGTWLGPYQLGPLTRGATPLIYPVLQAQPELIALGA